MSESFRKGIVQRVFRNFLDIIVLRLVQAEPMWGYKIIRYVEEEYGISIRHGALYPLLNSLEKKGFLRSRKEEKGGRVRKVYEITSRGIQLLDAYSEVLQEQIQKQDIKAA
ncbi:MAG: PadR family transcriptional regulator [Candidatus Bathyarchaeota archaeon]|nr:PadR family transcriptional regulator [Candidatus Bathyarchaeota archaeon]MDH5495162.1 PadR family transcriptional regulator [Candidatus Bathyarchaeota archaeon]